jgi:hypothetical protein
MIWPKLAFTLSLLSMTIAPHGAAAQDAPAGLGWSNTHFAGNAPGEIGGVISTAGNPFHYAVEITPRNFNDSMKASGSLCLPVQPATKAALFIGWFSSDLNGWRFPSCLGVWIPADDAPDDEVYLYALSGDWKGGVGAKPTGVRIARDGKKHRWALAYDGKANGGTGALSFTLDDQAPVAVNLAANYLLRDASLNRFGLLHAQAAANPLKVYVDDIQLDDRTFDFSSDPGWKAGGGGVTRERDFRADPRHANTAIPTGPITQDTLNDRIKPEPNGALSFYTRNSENKLVRRFMITPEGSLVAGGTVTNGPDIPLSNEPSMLSPEGYDNATNGARLSWVNDFHFGLHKSAGLGKMQGEGQPMLNLRVLGLMGRSDSPDIQLGRAGPDNGRTNYGPLEATEPGSCLGKIIFKAYIKEDEKVEGEWTGDIAGIHARNEATPTRERNPASLHFTTAGDSIKGHVRENIERMVIRSNGYVGIGDEFTSPAERLHVQGNIRADGDMIAGGAKKFVIAHPTQPGKQLVHAAIEGPESAVYYRGEAQLVSGVAEIQLPEYFEALTAKHGRTVMLTNVDGFDRLAVRKQDGNQVKDGKFIVMAESDTSTQAFTWEVKAVRADIPPLPVEQ